MAETETPIELATRLRDLGVTFRLRNNRLWVLPTAKYRALPEEDRAAIRQLRGELKRLALEGALSEAAPAPTPKKTEPAPEPTPVVYVSLTMGRRHLVCEADVLDTMRAAGESEAYLSGQIPKAKAYAMAALRIRQLMEFGLWRY